MKKLALILALIVSASFAHAQKGKVSSAASYLNSGKLDKAKEAIDTGISHDKCIAWAKAYLVKGKVYQGIYESPLPAYKSLSDDALSIALTAYNKAMELDIKGKYKKDIKAQLTNLIPDYTNEAVKYYNELDYKNALVAFEKVLEIENMELFADKKLIDTAVIFNAGMAAQKCEDWDKAIKYYKLSIEHNYGGAKSYAFLSNSYKSKEDNENTIKYLHKGFELFPNDSYMLVELINHYMLGGEPEKAAEYLDKAIAMDPTNSSFYSAKASLYEKTKELDKAEATYREALEIDPKNFTAQYNLGLLKLNEAIALHTEVNEIMDVKKYNDGVKVVFAKYADVIPYFERILEIKPNEPNSLSTLKELYFKLRNQDEKYLTRYNEIKAIIDAGL